MKVLFVTNMYPPSEHVYHGIHIKEQIESYVKLYQIQYKIYLVDGIKSKLNYFKSIFTVNHLIRQNKYDLVHIHFGLSGFFLLFNPFIKTPVILTLHGSDIQSFNKRDGLMQYVSRMVAGRCNKVIILNDRMAGILKKHKEKLVKIPCGIDLKIFDQDRKNTESKSFLIGFPAGKDRPVKNYALFSKIVTILKNEGYMIETIELHNLTRNEVVGTLTRLDCLLMTSLSEGSPQVIKEALACNVPIVSTKVGDVEQLLQDVTNCAVVDSFEAQPFVNKIKILIGMDPVNRISDGNIKIKQLGLDQESVVGKLHQLYTSVLQN